MNIEHGDADGQSGNFGMARGCDGAFDERDVGRSSSHIEGDDFGETAGAGGGGCADYASGGAGEDGADGFTGGGGERGDAAGGLHDENTGFRLPAFGFRKSGALAEGDRLWLLVEE